MAPLTVGALLACLSLQLCSALRTPAPPGAELAAPRGEADLQIKRRRYLYLVQGPDVVPEWLLAVANRTDSDAVFLAFKPEVHQERVGKVRVIEGRNTTWTSGRNLLYNESVRMQKLQGWRHEYIVFTDHDTGIQADFVDTWHRRLTAMQPAAAAIGDRNKCDLWPCGGDIDAQFNAFHATAAPIFLPYHTEFDERTWWASQAVMIALVISAAPDYVTEWRDLLPFAGNNAHGEYPRGFNKIRAYFMKYLRKKVNACLLPKLLSLKKQLLSIGSAESCHTCPLTDTCRNNTFCEGPQETPLRDFGEIIECKPF